MKTQNTKNKVDGILLSMVIIGAAGTAAALLLVIQMIML